METITILGGGAVGIALAVHLSMAGRKVRLVRVRATGQSPAPALLSLEEGNAIRRAWVECVSLDRLDHPDPGPSGGLLVVATKAFANAALARSLSARRKTGPLCLLQNGLGVEQPFREAGFAEIYRSVLYVTGEVCGPLRSSLKAIRPSLIGSVNGTADGVRRCVEALATPAFPFAASHDLEEAVWKKTIINSVFNSLCPLLETDNGIFSRSRSCRSMAREVIGECVRVANRAGVILSAETVLGQVLEISRASSHFISTLQDLRRRRRTEIDSLNLAICAVAETLRPPVPVPRTRLLGELVLLKSGLESNGHETHQGRNPPD